MSRVRIILLVVTLGLLGVGGWYAYAHLLAPVSAAPTLVPVTRGTVESVVDISAGQVQATTEVHLTLQKSGKIAKLPVVVGQHVAEGDLLVGLDTSDVDAQIAQAAAGIVAAETAVVSAEKNVRTMQAAADTATTGIAAAESKHGAEQSKLADMQKGSRAEDIALSQSQLGQARTAKAGADATLVSVQNKADTDMASLYLDVHDVLSSAVVFADTSLHQSIYSLFQHDTPTDTRIAFTTRDTSAESPIPWQYTQILAGLAALRTEVSAVGTDTASADAALSNAQKYLFDLGSFFESLAHLLNIATPSSTFSESALASAESTVGTIRTTDTTLSQTIIAKQKAITAQKVANDSALVAAHNAVSAAASAVDAAESALVLKKAGTSVDQIASEQAQVQATADAVTTSKNQAAQAELQVAGARAAVDQARAAVVQARTARDTLVVGRADMELHAPFGGTITQSDNNVGETITAGLPGAVPIITMISDEPYQIVAQVSDADIAVLAVGQDAVVVLDAFGSGEHFPAHIGAIDPTAVLTGNIPAYKVTLEFNQRDDRIKSGMHASVHIITATRSDVLLVPVRALLRQGEATVLSVQHPDGTHEQRTVTTGIVGTDGATEITSGISEGEQIILY